MNAEQNSILLTANDKIVTKNAQAAKNHCTLQTAIEDSSKPASNIITEVGIKILDTKISANATLTINALPGNMQLILVIYFMYWNAYDIVVCV